METLVVSQELLEMSKEEVISVLLVGILKVILNNVFEH